jgi:hypothetical protein
VKHNFKTTEHKSAQDEISSERENSCVATVVLTTWEGIKEISDGKT